MTIHKQKFIKNSLVISIVILVLIIVSPCFTYKFLLLFPNNNYIKLKTVYSSQDGFVLKENCDKLNLGKGEEIGEYLIGIDKITDEISSIKYGLSGNKFNLYGTFIKNDNGKEMFQIENWSSPNTKLVESYMWELKLSKIYYIILIPVILLIILCIWGLIKIHRKKV